MSLLIGDRDGSCAGLLVSGRSSLIAGVLSSQP